MVRLAWHIDGPPSTWAQQLARLDWVTPKIKTWMQQRAAKFGSPADGESLADNTASLWNLIPGSAQGVRLALTGHSTRTAARLQHAA